MLKHKLQRIIGMAIQSLAFRLYVSALRGFEKRNRKSIKDPLGHVLVELDVPGYQYVFGNLVIAYFLAGCDKRRIVCVFSDRMESRRRRLVRKMVHRWGVGEIYTLSRQDWCLGNRYDQSEIHRIFNSSENFKERVSRLSIDGCRVGDLVYDSVLRKALKPTLTMDLKTRIMFEFRYACATMVMFERISHSTTIETFVTGHSTYVFFGTLARRVLQIGGVVYSRKPYRGRILMRKYRPDIPNDMNLPLDTHAPIDLKRHLPATAIPRLRKEGQDRVQRRLIGQDDPKKFVGYSDEKTYIPGEKVKRGLGWDENSLVIGVAGGVMIETPHGVSWSVYEDVFEFVKNTITIGKENQNIRWLYKPHPNSGRFRFSEPPIFEESNNVRIFSNNYTQRSFFEAVDAVITFRGTASIEFSALGKPGIVTSETGFYGWGAAHEFCSKEDFEDFLRNVENRFSCLVWDRDEAALCVGIEPYLWVQAVFLDVKECTAMLGKGRGIIKSLTRLRDNVWRLGKYNSLEDPFFRSWKDMEEKGTTNLFDYEGAGKAGT